MKIKKIKIENFRLLKNFDFDLEEDLSLVIGKNNTGKTSLLSLMEKFLTDKSGFSINDFNLDCQGMLKSLQTNESIALAEDFDFSIRLFFEIHYDDKDDLKNLSSLILSLDSENVVVLGFEYYLNPQQFGYLKTDFENFKKENNSKDIIDFLRLSIGSKYFKSDIKTHEYLGGNKLGKHQLITDKKLISRIINIQSIKAKREVNNSDSNRPDKTLSKLSSDYYESLENTQQEEQTISELNKKLEATDKELDKVYPKVFKEVLDKVQLFGGKTKGESAINVISTLQSKNILKENTSVVYKHAETFLPEDYNGLGYLNLFSMIFDLEIMFREFRKEREIVEDQIPADINILFIEEPEAHTHPQMQHVFINNISNILKKESLGLDVNGDKSVNKSKFNLQSIITTHSSHIVAESNFNQIKYFHKAIDKNEVDSRSLKDLEAQYEKGTNQYQFLKQYLTLNRAELFFADKAILIEGDTERILLPAMMNKLDLENKFDSPLLSQNISVVEVGAYSHIFEKLIDFVGIKYLLITDIDSCNDLKKACRVESTEANNTSNSSLKHFLPNKSFIELKNAITNEKVAEKNLTIAYQHKEDGYHARSFEDAFIHINRAFVKTNKAEFEGLKNSIFFDLDGAAKKDAYSLADECIKKKTHFALDIVYHSDEDYSNWQIPSYIKTGLLWLQK